VKKFIDESVKVRGKLENKVGAAFSSSAHRAGGRETTMLSILEAMLIHGMVVCGDPLSTGGHYGAASNGSPDEQAERECRELGRRVALLAERLKGLRG
jgi:NAD(P)H dehydrogenase (quinone)